METMLESEAMAILVGAGVSYGRREAALRAAGSALAILEEPEAYAAQLQARGVALRPGPVVVVRRPGVAELGGACLGLLSGLRVGDLDLDAKWQIV